MAKYKDRKTLEALGKKIAEYRTSKELSVEDVAEMTGFAARTIRNIEIGEETTVSFLIAVCQAIGLHPKQALDIELVIKPRFPLSASRKEKSRLTQRIENFINTNYFRDERSAKEVVAELNAVYKIDTTTSAVSVILNRKVEDLDLQSKKKNSVTHYKKNNKK